MEMLLCLVVGASLAGGSGEPVAPGVSYLYQPSFCMDYTLRQPAVPYVPQPGDIFLATACEIWAKLGHWAARAEAPQHSGIMVALPNGRMGLLEAGPRNTLHCAILDPVPEMQWYTQKDRVWIRRRRIPLTPEQSAQLTNLALAVNGKPFALFRMLGQLTPVRRAIRCGFSG